MLVIIGDEDDSTHDLAVHLKQHVPRCGVLSCPRPATRINLEEPAAFNAAVQDFLHAVENGTAGARVTVAGKSYTLIPRDKQGLTPVRRSARRAPQSALLRRQRRDLHVLRAAPS